MQNGHGLDLSRSIRRTRRISLTSSGMCLPGMAAMPVMKSDVMNGLSTTDRWHEGVCCRGSRLKWMGMRITGIWPMMLWYSGMREVYNCELQVYRGRKSSFTIIRHMQWLKVKQRYKFSFSICFIRRLIHPEWKKITEATKKSFSKP